jgi:predicted phosphodiesterase
MGDITWLLHLSDIHFNKPNKTSYDPYDLDVDLRDQLEADVARVRARVGRIHGVIISGDVAFAGREPEYEVALGWLRKLTGICGCPPEAVWCVPGNHDGDRSVFDKSLNLRNLHNTLRPMDPDSVDALLGEAIRDAESAATLFRPLEHYNNSFASKFSCRTAPSALAWEARLPLNDRSVLVLRGANSVLVSDSSDNNRERKLILGTLQATAPQRPGETVVFICHHPLDWLADCDKLTPILNARSRVQLFGHKHLHAVDTINNCLRVVAGAVQPDRREPRWRPRYNCLGFSVISTPEGRKLHVDLFPRVWSDQEPKFIPDFSLCGGADHMACRLDLDPWDPPPADQAVSATSQGAPPTPGTSSSERPGGDAMNPAKTLTYRFLSLPHLVRLEIAQGLGLLREEDEGLFDAELLDRILKRAADENRLAELWDRIEDRHGDHTHTVNPYARH